MIYFCADDYGISKESNSRIENCLENGVLNKISVLPNGELDGLENLAKNEKVKLSLHINLVEGKPLSNPKDIDLIVSKDGFFRCSFIGLFFLSLFGKRKRLKEQLYKEIQKQIVFWKNYMSEDETLSIDSHQHTHMIPLIFKVLLRVIKDEGLKVQLRIPSEPLKPYILTPSLYTSYKLKGVIKQWLLKVLGFYNSKRFKKSGHNTSLFMGVMFSGQLTEKKIKKVLSHYSKIATKQQKDIEIGFHPGYAEGNEKLIAGARTGFEEFYFSAWRKKEYETLLNYKF